MPDKKSLITLDNTRLVGTGQITSFVRSTESSPGFLLGSTRGLYHLEKTTSTPKRIRPNPVIYVHSGTNGAVCYEEVKGHGQIAILDSDLKEKQVDAGLARTINPKAYWHNGLILLHNKFLVYYDLDKRQRTPLVEFPATRMVGQFDRVVDGYEFIAVLKEDNWPTYLYRLVVDPGNPATLIRLAAADDPVLARDFCKLSNNDYLVIPQGISAFYILRVFEGDKPELRLWSLIPMPDEIHPAGMLIEGDNLYIAAADCLVTFKLADSIAG